jgi:hypothetical protein
MTPPILVFFGYDAVPKVTPKVFLRTLLYSTSARGQIVEGMHVKLLRNGNQQLFSFWGYGETKNLVPGSGLYVGQTGVEANHHFVLSVHQPNYEFVAGTYSILVFAQLAGRSEPIQLAKITVAVPALTRLSSREKMAFCLKWHQTDRVISVTPATGHADFPESSLTRRFFDSAARQWQTLTPCGSLEGAITTSGNGPSLASFRASTTQRGAFSNWKAGRNARCFFAFTPTHPPTSRTPKLCVVSNTRARKHSICCNAPSSDFPEDHVMRF